MNGWMNEMLSNGLLQRIAWALVHFIWQGAVVAAMLAMGLQLLKRKRPHVKWAACALAMAVLAAMPIATAFLVTVEKAPTVSFEPVKSPVVAAGEVHVQSPERPAPSAPMIESAPRPADVHVGAAGRAQPEAKPAPVAAPVATSDDSGGWRHEAQAALQPLLPWGLLAWAAGVAALSVWHIGGWVLLMRARRLDVCPVGGHTNEIFEALLWRMKITRPVRLLESARVAVPVVIGVLRPAVLVPASVLTGLTPLQLEAVLAHELAHIRRYDALVRLLQAVVETLLFYHPAVWWVSRQISQQAEHCCDEAAVSICGDRRGFAEVLMVIAERGHQQRRLAVAADGGKLLPRIRRILLLSEEGSPRWTAISAALSVLLLAALILVPLACRTEPSAAWTPIPTSPPAEPATSSRVVALPSGIKVELLGAVDRSSGGRCWFPDGKLTTQRELSETVAKYKVSADIMSAGSIVTFVFRVFPVSLSSDDNVGATWLIDPPAKTPTSLAQSLGRTLTETYFLGTTAVPEGIGRAKFRIGVASGEWKTVLTSPAKGSTGGPDGIIGRPVQMSADVIVTVTCADVTDKEIRLVAVDNAGTQHTFGSHSIISNLKYAQSEIKLEGLRLSDVKEFRLQMRPYEWADFDNVAMRPGAPATAPASSSASAPATASAPSDKAVKSDPPQLVGAEIAAKPPYLDGGAIALDLRYEDLNWRLADREEYSESETDSAGRSVGWAHWFVRVNGKEYRYKGMLLVPTNGIRTAIHLRNGLVDGPDWRPGKYRVQFIAKNLLVNTLDNPKATLLANVIASNEVTFEISKAPFVAEPSDKSGLTTSEAAKGLGLVLPVEVKKVEYYKDGGTTGIILSDAKGKEYPFCHDGRESGVWPQHVFVGATYPNRPGANEVPFNDPVEVAIVLLLKTWAASKATPQEQARLIDSPTGVEGLTQQEVDLYRVCNVIRFIEAHKKVWPEVPSSTPATQPATASTPAVEIPRIKSITELTERKVKPVRVGNWGIYLGLADAGTSAGDAMLIYAYAVPLKGAKLGKLKVDSSRTWTGPTLGGLVYWRALQDGVSEAPDRYKMDFQDDGSDVSEGALFCDVIRVERKGDMRVEVTTLDGELLASANVKVKELAPQYWHVMAETVRNRNQGDLEFIAGGASEAALPAYPAIRPMSHTLQKNVEPGTLPSADKDELSGGIPLLKLSLDKSFHITSPIKMDDDVELRFLARWWLNGKPVAATKGVSRAIMRARPVHKAEAIEVAFGLPECMKGLKAGDEIGLQVLYCPMGWRSGPMAMALASDGSSAMPELSNRLDFKLTQEMIDAAAKARTATKTPATARATSALAPASSSKPAASAADTELPKLMSKLRDEMADAIKQAGLDPADVKIADRRVEYAHNCGYGGKTGYQEKGANPIYIDFYVDAQDAQGEFRMPNRQWSNLHMMGWADIHFGKDVDPKLSKKLTDLTETYFKKIDELDKTAASAPAK